MSLIKHENGHQPQQVNVSSWERVLSAGTGTLILSKSLGRYRVPGREIASTLSRLTGMASKETLERALKQVKAHFETGEVPTVEGQPRGAGKSD